MTSTLTSEVLQLDPKELHSHALHLRSKAPDVSDLVGSIKANGIIEPLVVIPPTPASPDNYIIVAGHRRAAAAVQLGLETVPCVVWHGFAEDGGDAHAIHAMLGENTARQNLSAADEASAFQQLALVGVKVGDIAATTGRKKEDVEVSITLAMAPKALAIAKEHNLTLTQSATLAEFEDDRETLKSLTRAAVKDPTRFEYEAEQARRAATVKKAIETAAAPLIAKGVKVVYKHPSGERVDYLKPSKDGKVFTMATHAKCPGHMVYIGPPYYGQAKANVEAYCSDPKGNGHVDRWSGTSSSRGESPAESKKALEKRRQTLAGNKAWKEATKARREFIVALLDKELTAEQWDALWRLVIVQAATHSGALAIGTKVQRLLYCDLVGLEHPKTAGYDFHAYRDRLEAAEPGRAFDKESLAYIAAAFDGPAEWQHLKDQVTSLPTRGWLKFLELCGHVLTEIETAKEKRA